MVKIFSPFLVRGCRESAFEGICHCGLDKQYPGNQFFENLKSKIATYI